MSVSATTGIFGEQSPAAGAKAAPSPRFSDFRFTTIGKQPKLLARMSDAIPAQEEEQSDIYGDAEEAETQPISVASSSDGSLALRRSRPSLLEALAGEDVFMNGLDDTANTSISGFSPLSASTSILSPKGTLPSGRLSGEHSQSQPIANSFNRPPKVIPDNIPASASRSVLSHFGQASTSPDPNAAPSSDSDAQCPPIFRSLSPITFATNEAVPSLEALRILQAKLSTTLTNMSPIDVSEVRSLCLTTQEQCASVLEFSKQAHLLAQQALVSAQASIEAAQRSLVRAEAMQDSVHRSTTAVEDIGPAVLAWNVSVDSLKQDLNLLDKWARDKAKYEEHLRREAEAKEVERIQREDILRQQMPIRPLFTPLRARSPQHRPTLLSSRLSVGPDTPAGNLSIILVEDEEADAAQKALALLRQQAFERKQLAEEELQRRREAEELLEQEHRAAEEAAAARAAELARLKAERFKAEEEERARQEEDEKEAERRKLELEERARTKEAQRKLVRERKLAEEKEMKEKIAREAQALKHQQEESAKQLALQARAQQCQRQSSQTSPLSSASTHPPTQLPSAQKSVSISPTTQTHPLPPNPVAAAVHANGFTVGNATALATLTSNQKSPGHGSSRVMLSTKPILSGSKASPTQDPRLRHKPSLSGSKSASSLTHTSPNAVQPQPLPSVPTQPFNTDTQMIVDAPSLTNPRRSLPPGPSVASGPSNPSSKHSTPAPLPSTPSPLSPGGRGISFHNRGGDFGNLGIVLNTKVTPLSPDAQKANLRRVMEASASRVKKEEDESNVKVEEGASNFDPTSMKIGPPRRRALSGGVKVSKSQVVPKPEVQSPVVPSTPAPLAQLSPPPPYEQPPAAATTSRTEGSDRSQSHPDTQVPVQSQRLAQPPLPSRQRLRAKDPDTQPTSNVNPLTPASTSNVQGNTARASSSVPVPTLAVEPPTPAVSRVFQGLNISNSGNPTQSPTNLSVPTNQSQLRNSPSMNAHEGMGPDPMTTGGWSGAVVQEDDKQDNLKKQGLPTAPRSRQYDHYSPAPPAERAVGISRRPSGGSRAPLRVDHYSPPPRVRSRDPSPLYRGRRSPPPSSRILTLNNRNFSPPRPLSRVGRSRSPVPSSRCGGRSRSPRPLSRDGPPPALAGRKRAREDELDAAPPMRRSRYSDGVQDYSATNHGPTTANSSYDEDWSRSAAYNRSPSPEESRSATSLARRMEPTPAEDSSKAPLSSRMDPTPEPPEPARHIPHWHQKPLYRGGYGHNTEPYRHSQQHVDRAPRTPVLLHRIDTGTNGDVSYGASSASYRGGYSNYRGRGRGGSRGGYTSRGSNNTLFDRLEA